MDLVTVAIIVIIIVIGWKVIKKVVKLGEAGIGFGLSETKNQLDFASASLEIKNAKKWTKLGAKVNEMGTMTSAKDVKNSIKEKLKTKPASSSSS